MSTEIKFLSDPLSFFIDYFCVNKVITFSRVYIYNSFSVHFMTHPIVLFRILLQSGFYVMLLRIRVYRVLKKYYIIYVT